MVALIAIVHKQTEIPQYLTETGHHNKGSKRMRFHALKNKATRNDFLCHIKEEPFWLPEGPFNGWVSKASLL